MGSVLSVIVALTLAAEAPAVPARTRPGVTVLAFVGAGLVTAGLGFEISGRAGRDPRAPVYEWRPNAEANIVGGLSLIAAGLCLITIAAVLTRWQVPAVSLSVTPGGARLALGATWP
ncbi:MAG: hypothetical protein Q8N23_35990 [Archangium sp.]|nr:hypothetical protein [Archangium sp.]MDP3158129.1 hypothetical protein [Archangium sp.]MDP3570464.1 hypothetical protein [Archangium sp.]